MNDHLIKRHLLINDVKLTVLHRCVDDVGDITEGVSVAALLHQRLFRRCKFSILRFHDLFCCLSVDQLGSLFIGD